MRIWPQPQPTGRWFASDSKACAVARAGIVLNAGYLPHTNRCVPFTAPDLIRAAWAVYQYQQLPTVPTTPGKAFQNWWMIYWLRWSNATESDPAGLLSRVVLAHGMDHYGVLEIFLSTIVSCDLRGFASLCAIFPNTVQFQAVLVWWGCVHRVHIECMRRVGPRDERNVRSRFRSLLQTLKLMKGIPFWWITFGMILISNCLEEISAGCAKGHN